MALTKKDFFAPGGGIYKPSTPAEKKFTEVVKEKEAAQKKSYSGGSSGGGGGSGGGGAVTPITPAITTKVSETTEKATTTQKKGETKFVPTELTSTTSRYYPGVSIQEPGKYKTPLYYGTETGEKIIVGYDKGYQSPYDMPLAPRKETKGLTPSFTSDFKFSSPAPEYKINDSLIGTTSVIGGTMSIPGPEPEYPEVIDISKGASTSEKLLFKEQYGGGGVATGFAGGVLSVGAGVLGFGKAIITQPGETFGQTILSIPQIPTQFGEFGTRLRTAPGFAMGEVAGNIGLYYGFGLAKKGLLKGYDIIRTAGQTELKAEQIIAPEIYAGQKFPLVYKGETAGKLLGEFKPMLPGERLPAGFTSAPKPFEKVTEAGFGSSELPGIYQSPRVSPHFLKISSEETKLFTFNPLGETMRPSIIRITPTEFKLVPGLKAGTKIIQSQRIGQIREFLLEAPKGKSYVTFIKPEKEAIIPFGTPLQQTGKRFFIKYEGRRVPIFEFKVVPGGAPFQMNLPTAFDISKSLSSSRIGKIGLISPTEVLGISSQIYSKPSRVSSSVLSRVSSYISPVSSVYISYAPKTSYGFGISRGSFYKGQSYAPRYSVSKVLGYGGYGGVSRASVLTAPKLIPPRAMPFNVGGEIPDMDFSFIKREFKRIPSFRAVVGKGLGLPTPTKLSKGKEELGLFEVKYIKPQRLGVLGPYKIKSKRKNRK